MNEQTRPPLGIMPEHIWDIRRFEDLQSAIARNYEANKPIPKEWLNEFVTISLKSGKYNTTKGTKQ